MKIDERRIFYVYMYFRLDGTPCYVGCGTGCRWVRHERGISNRHLNRIIRKSGGTLPRVKILENITRNEALDAEILLIAEIGREANGGPLVNLTDGGGGCSGHTVSAEGRKKMSEKWHAQSDEIKANRKRLQAEAMRRPEVRAKLSEANKRRRGPPAPEVERLRGRSLMSAKRLAWLAANPNWKRGAHSEDTKALLSEKTRKYYEEHPERRNFSDGHKDNIKAGIRLSRAKKQSSNVCNHFILAALALAA